MTNRSLGMPFTRLREMVQETMEELSNEPEVNLKYNRRINQMYQHDIPNYFEFDFLRRNASIRLVVEHTTGNVDVSVGSTSVAGGTTSPAFTSDMTGRKFKFAGNDEIYTFTFVSSTSGTISPAFTGDTALTDDNYAIFQDVYDLETDFSWHTTEPNFFYNVSGGTQNLTWLDEEEFNYRFTTTGAEYATYWREFPGLTSLGLHQVQITPYPTKLRLLQYDYFKQLDELQEFTTDTATTTLGSATVTTSADFSASISAGQFFRIDGDNAWRKIITVATTTLTLDNVYPTTNSAQAYTVCDALQIPAVHENAIYYGACMLTEKEQGGRGGVWAALYQNELDKMMKKRNRKRFGRRNMKRPMNARRYR